MNNPNQDSIINSSVNLNSSGEDNLPEVNYKIDEKEICPILYRIPDIQIIQINAVKALIERNGITKKIPLNSQGQVIGNLLEYFAGRELGILRDTDFMVVDVPPEEQQEQILLDLFLNLHYDKTRLSLIAAEYYYELAEINKNIRSQSLRIGLNTRKEVASMIGISEGYLGQALRLRKNPIIFKFLKNSEYTFKDVKLITGIQEYSSYYFNKLLKNEITLQNAWYGLDKKSKKLIESNKKDEPMENSLTDYYDDLEFDANINQKLNSLAKSGNDVHASITSRSNDDENSDSLIELKTLYETENHNSFLNNVIDDEELRTSILNNLSTIDKKAEKDEIDEWLAEDETGVMPINNYFNNENKSIYRNTVNSGLSSTFSETTDTDSDLENENKAETVSNLMFNHYSGSNFIFKNFDIFFDNMDYVIFKDVAEEKFSNPFEGIAPEILDEQKKNLNWLIENGKIHQHKRIRRNIGNIINKFENKDPKVISSKDQKLLIDMLDASVRITMVEFKFIQNLKTRLKEFSLEEQAELDVITEKMEQLENRIQDYIFYE